MTGSAGPVPSRSGQPRRTSPWPKPELSPLPPPAFSEEELRHGELVGWYTVACSQKKRADRLHRALVDVGVIARTRMQHAGESEGAAYHHAVDCWACILAELSDEALGNPLPSKRGSA